MIHNISESLWQNVTVETLQIVNSNADEKDDWLVYEFDNITLIDNAPYVGLRKVDSLIHYLLVRARTVDGRDDSSRSGSRNQVVIISRAVELTR